MPTVQRSSDLKFLCSNVDDTQAAIAGFPRFYAATYTSSSVESLCGINKAGIEADNFQIEKGIVGAVGFWERCRCQT